MWFTSLTKPGELGPATVDGAVWTKETVKSGEVSDPFLFAGWEKRMGWIKNHGKQPVIFTYEVDKKGNNEWEELMSVGVEPGQADNVLFPVQDKGEWIRVKVDKNTTATVTFTYTSSDPRSLQSDGMYAGLVPVTENNLTGGLLYGLGNNRRALGVLATQVTDGNVEETGYYEMGDKLELVRKEDAAMADTIRSRFAIPHQIVTVGSGSVLIVDDANRRWRLPLGNEAYAPLMEQAQLRICREVATERDLFSCMGTFYELPAENADGYAKIRPISSHGYRIHDLCFLSGYACPYRDKSGRGKRQ